MRRLLGTALLLLACATCAASPALAAWPHDAGAGNVPMCTATFFQYILGSVPDGSGGIITVWQDYRLTQVDVYVQRVNAAGVAMWTADGVRLTNLPSDQTVPAIASDGNGGAIVTWQDNRSGTNDIYAQRVNNAGVPQWTANGVPVCAAINSQASPQIAADLSGGAFIVWADSRQNTSDLYQQHLNSAGAPLLTVDGQIIYNQASFFRFTMAADGAGGYLLAYSLSSATVNDHYVQHFNSSGNPLWQSGGLPVCQAADQQLASSIIPDGSGGAIVAWIDYRAGFAAGVYAQHISSQANILWTTDGTPVCVSAGPHYSAHLASDGSGGAYVSWDDTRAGPFDVYAQHLSAGGTALWTANGLAVGNAAGDQLNQQIVSDGLGGAIVAWSDARSGTSDLYAQRLNSAGVSQWAAGGAPICTAAGFQNTPTLVSDGSGGAVIAWQDGRNSSNGDIYAQRIERNGFLGNPEPSIVNVRDVLNDQGGKVKVTWNASWLDTEGNTLLYAYQVLRSVPASLAQAAIRDGAQRVTDPLQIPQPGHRAFLTLPNSSQAIGWEYVSIQYPLHYLSTYAYLSPTTCDSIAAGNPKTSFMVVAIDASGTKYWMSAPDSGYSVDNIPPSVPAPFLGQYGAGQAKLHWDPVNVADLAGYNLYRGNSPSFAPSAATLLTTRPDTGYVDNAGTAYVYKLSAVDVHGNESAVTTWFPSNALAVGDGNAAALAFAAPSPNPARGATTLRYSLAQAGHVRLAVFDASGRRVRMLADAAQEAGAHEAAFELADDAGRALPPGLYLARLEAAGRVITRRIAAVR